MPRITVITNEQVYKYDRQKYIDDPGAFRSPNDYCMKCWPKIDITRMAVNNQISTSFAKEQIEEIADSEGHWDDDHPDYECDDYRCVQCGRRLTEKD